MMREDSLARVLEPMRFAAQEGRLPLIDGPLEEEPTPVSGHLRVLVQ
jgi:hypothetical protein